jgi:hypothetical protein
MSTTTQCSEATVSYFTFLPTLMEEQAHSDSGVLDDAPGGDLAPGAPRRVLVVDDSLLMRSAASLGLGRVDGWEVATASCGRDGRGTDLLGQAGVDPDAGLGTGILLFAYAWPAVSMLAAYAVKQIEVQRGMSWLARPLLYLVGYGPLLCAITAAAYVEEARGSALVWEKTEKLGAVGDLA